jgi:hypothetical protein
VIAGKSVPWEGEAKCFSFVNTYDEKPKRRLYELLKSQGLQMNQDITFLSDGGDTVRDLQFYISPFSETTTVILYPIMVSDTGMEKLFPRRLWNRRLIGWSANGWSRNSKCAGRNEERIYCYRHVPRHSTENCVIPSAVGIPI